MIYNDVELININLTERKGFLCLTFFETNLKKELYIKKKQFIDIENLLNALFLLIV